MQLIRAEEEHSHFIINRFSKCSLISKSAHTHLCLNSSYTQIDKPHTHTSRCIHRSRAHITRTSTYYWLSCLYTSGQHHHNPHNTNSHTHNFHQNIPHRLCSNNFCIHQCNRDTPDPQDKFLMGKSRSRSYCSNKHRYLNKSDMYPCHRCKWHKHLRIHTLPPISAQSHWGNHHCKIHSDSNNSHLRRKNSDH